MKLGENYDNICRDRTETCTSQKQLFTSFKQHHSMKMCSINQQNVRKQTCSSLNFVCMWWFLIKKKNQEIKGHFLVITRTVAARKLLHQQKQKWSSQKPGWQQFLEGRSEEARSFGSGKRRGKIITTEEQKKLFPEDWQHPAAYVTQKKTKTAAHRAWRFITLEEWNESKTASAPSRSLSLNSSLQEGKEKSDSVL